MTPFDRCDTNATAVLDDAIGRARRARHPHVGTEHVLAALAARRSLLHASVATALPAPEQLDALVHASPVRHSHDTALATIGVDLDAVRAAARRTFGDDAVDRLARRRVRQPWQPWRRPSRRCTALLAGALAVSPRLKQALACAADHTEDRGLITPTALLAALLDTPGARSSALLEQAGVDIADLRSRLPA